jgi:serine protease Do
VALRDEMLRDKNTALAAVQANRVEPTARTDQRMESVVAIYVGGGGMGSGFYITPDLVMTNYHVVEQSRLVEMRLSNGQETFGRVEASDVRLDLALIRVQTRGKPVQFFDGNRLDLGASVDVLGHPARLLFSLTRGVVSAVRTGPSPNEVGGRPFLQLQYDAASSPGNSGGPVFMNDKVVAVVSYGKPGEQRTNQNLNFGIHYREVLDWLREKNIQVAVQR